MTHVEQQVQALVQGCSELVGQAIDKPGGVAISAAYTLLVNVLACIKDDTQRRVIAAKLAADLEKDCQEIRRAAIQLRAMMASEVVGHA